ncbi:MAG: carboxypeptidase regulatory-like domain-containing protein [Bacteroidetes bacterium]|nr:carboxypeptidase regulatory-like domain-containing protein [Bacteroidota bacterium]
MPLLVLFFYSCKKDAGEGGGASISGKLFSKNFHSPEAPYTEDDIEADKKIYITYGDEKIPDDDTRTGIDGSFKFSYLRKGTYNIFTYSLNPASASDDSEIPVIQTVEITKNNQQITLDDLVIYEKADNNGSSTIRGRVFVKKYISSFTFVVDSFYVADEDVFAVYGREFGISKRIRTSHDGSFEFSNLRKGTYSIYVLSKDKEMQTSTNIPVLKEVKITANNQVVVMPDIVIAK